MLRLFGRMQSIGEVNFIQGMHDLDNVQQGRNHAPPNKNRYQTYEQNHFHCLQKSYLCKIIILNNLLKTYFVRSTI